MIAAPVPHPAADQVLIQVDVFHLRHGSSFGSLGCLGGETGDPLQQIIGHEFSGHVVEIGKAVQGFKIGDSVTEDSHIPCLKCAWTRGQIFG